MKKNRYGITFIFMLGYLVGGVGMALALGDSVWLVIGAITILLAGSFALGYQHCKSTKGE